MSPRPGVSPRPIAPPDPVAMFSLNRILLRLWSSCSSDPSLAVHLRYSTLNLMRLFSATNKVVEYRLDIIKRAAEKGWGETAERIAVITATLAMTKSGSCILATQIEGLPVRLPVSIVSRTILFTILLVSVNCSPSGARALSWWWLLILRLKDSYFTYVVCHTRSYYDVTHRSAGLPGLYAMLLISFNGPRTIIPPTVSLERVLLVKRFSNDLSGFVVTATTIARAKEAKDILSKGRELTRMSI